VNVTISGCLTFLGHDSKKLGQMRNCRAEYLMYFQTFYPGASKGTAGNTKCVTEILWGDKNKKLGGQSLPFCFNGK